MDGDPPRSPVKSYLAASFITFSTRCVGPPGCHLAHNPLRRTNPPPSLPATPQQYKASQFRLYIHEVPAAPARGGGGGEAVVYTDYTGKLSRFARTGKPSTSSQVPLARLEIRPVYGGPLTSRHTNRPPPRRRTPAAPPC